jgi:hypothetical protein
MVVILSSVLLPHWGVAVVDRVMTAWLLIPTRSEGVVVAEVVGRKTTLTPPAWQKVVLLSNRPLLRADSEMRGAGVSTETPVFLITAAGEVGVPVGRDGPWSKIREDGGESVVTDFMFRNSPRWATAVGLPVVEEESFTLTGRRKAGRRATTEDGAEEAEEDGLLARFLTVPPVRPTLEEEVAADGIKCRALLVEPVW